MKGFLSIGRTLAVTAITLVLYQQLIPFLPRRFNIHCASPRRANIQRAQSFLYNEQKHAAAVIVGSSMSQVIKARAFGPGCVNLALAGGSAVTGLELVRRSGAHPDWVLIEMNLAAGGADEELLQYVFRPGTVGLRGCLSMFQDQNQPFDFYAAVSAAASRKVRKLLDLPALGAQTVASPKVVSAGDDCDDVDPVLFRSFEDALLKAYDFEPDSALLNRSFRSIALNVQELQGRGCVCLFYETPVEPELWATKWWSITRRAAHQFFPESQFVWIHDDPAQDYRTKDGNHLTERSALRYTAYLAQQVTAVVGKAN